ncbi:DUF6892 domain-containing protein [Dactylosporangium cerinum]|uniref:DUF6892 domain-containing protein n=1 Tax=Dactylosporangium cerinum TaxID=1434730 RepID=A0ABV9VQI6_9ACTN
MDPCLRLALLETADVPAQRYDELLVTPIPPDTDEGRWTDRSELFEAVPDGVDTTIRSLDGIAQYPDVGVLHLVESAVEDVAPFAALPSLRLLSLGVTPAADLRPLLDCARLTRVDIDWHTPEQREILMTLADRGVHVDSLLPDPSTLTAPFADQNLKLAVIDLLGLPLPTAEFFDEYALDEANLARVLAIELTQEQLDGIERLHWTGGGYHIQHAVWSQWDGESDEFDIRSLEGIETLRNLKRLEVTPLKLIPEEQIAALRAASVTVTSW